ncbi:J domain-containing protein, partial [Vibrio neonatus]
KEKGKEINDLLNKITELEQVINSSPNNSPYEILGLKFGETNKKLIKSNYIKLSNIYHFDRSGSNEMMKKINIAYDKLK